jgi:hypothetical protein
MLEICRHSNAGAFLTRAESWLIAREIEYAGAYASARAARRDDSRYQQPVYWATVEDDGRVIGCAYRTPPYKVGVTALPTAAIEPLVASLREFYQTVAGVSGPDETATALARAWTARYGGTYAEAAGTRQRLLAAPAVEAPPAAPPGTLRAATSADEGLVRTWGNAAASESGIAVLDGTLCVRLMQAGQLFVWDDGRPRAMVGMLRATAQGAGIGIVYTPMDWRRQGYARAAVAALAARLLARGPRCFVYTDADSPPINALARQLGFEAVHETVDIDIR